MRAAKRPCGPTTVELTAIRLALGAAVAAMAAGAPKAQTVVTGTQTSTQAWGSGDLTIDAGALVSVASPLDGVSASGASLGTLTNSGTIAAAGGMGVVNSGTMAALTNEGTGRIGTVIGIGNVGSIGTLSNEGTIQGSAEGIDNNNVGVPGYIGVLNNSGLISATAWLGVGIYDSGRIGTLTNSGTIASASWGIRVDGGRIDTLDNSGSIVGSGIYGIESDAGTIGTLRNSGTIRGFQNGILNLGTIGSLINSGVIGDARSGGMVNLGGIGTISNSGTIWGMGNAPGWAGSASTLTTPGPHGTIDAVINSGLITLLGNNGFIGAVRNSGTIAGVNSDGQIGVLDNSGTITAAPGAQQPGVYNVGHSNSTTLGTIGTLTNSGVISAVDGIFNAGIVGALTNTGTISGTTTGIFNSGSIGTLTNSGAISGAVYAIHNSSTGTLGPIANIGAIEGNILNESARDVTITGGSGSVFGTLTGHGGTSGTIISTASNVVFAAGNVLLDDDVDVGSNTVANTASTLRINRAVSIAGNYSQGAAATLLVGVGSGAVTSGAPSTDAGYGRLVVSGSATVAPGSSITLQKTGSYGFAAGQRYVVIDAAASGTNYNAGALNYSIAGYTSVLSAATVSTGQRSDLVVTVVSAAASGSSGSPGSGSGSGSGTGVGAGTGSGSSSGSGTLTAPSLAGTPNAASSLSGLLDYTGISPALLNLFNAATALSLGTSAEATGAGVRLGPAPQAAASRAAAAPALDVLTTVGARLDSLRMGQGSGTGVSTGEDGPRTGIWGQVLGGHASQAGMNQVDGYSANYTGLLFGADRALGDDWRAGGAFSYTNTAINDTGASAGDWMRVNAYGLTAYASYTAPRWYANLSAGAVFQHYDTSRTVSFTGFSGAAQGKFDGMQYVARAEAGYPLAFGAYTVTPIASLTYSYLKQNGYTESGGNGAALTVDATHAASVKSDLGIRLERGFSTPHGMLVPAVQMAWRHEYDHARAVTTSTFAADASGETTFATTGASPVLDMAVISVGATLLEANHLSLTARYELQAAPRYRSQAGTLRLRKLF